MNELKPILKNSISVRHKLINEQPFLELTILANNGGTTNSRKIDETTFAPHEFDRMIKTIKLWMYDNH